jgi:hypothetical protein
VAFIPADFDRPLGVSFRRVDPVKLEGGVNVTFKPTYSYYRFDRLIRPHDMIERLGPITSSATVRHMSWAADTSDYNADEIAIMAYQLASEAALEAYGRGD